MAASTVQRNTLVAPFSVNSPLLDAPTSEIKVRGKEDSSGKKPVSVGPIAITHQRWLTQVQQAINTSAQIQAAIPANSNAEGEPGTFAFDSNWLYICVGKNTWRRAALNVF